MNNIYERAYEQAKAFIQRDGIPRWFYHGSDANISKGVFGAIADNAKLTCKEQEIYDRIKEVDFRGQRRIWYQGGYQSIDGFDDKEIRGAKMFMAHGYVLKLEGG